MVEAQDGMVVWITDPAAIVNNAALATTEVDTVQSGIAFDYATIIVRLGATDVALTTLKVSETDTTGAGYTDIPGAAIAPLPTAVSDGTTYAFYIDLRGRKRFLDLNVVVGNGATGAFVTALCILSRAKEATDTAAARGLAGEVIIPIA